MDYVYAKYQQLLDNADPRVESWLLMKSPLNMILILLAYFLFVYFGPRLMADRKPFNLTRVLQIYNLSMVIFSAYMVYELLVNGWITGYTLGCQPVDYSNSESGVRMAGAAWWFLIAKFIELLDTVFIILRKKFNQVSFLHVFHHGFLPFNWWFGIKLAPGGFGSFHCLVNATVHVIMYAYYFLASFGPSVQKYLWWKRYITRIQITQFVIVAIHSSQAFFWTDCAYPKIFIYMILAYEVIFLILFTNFYVKTYRKKAVETHKSSNGMTNGIRNGKKD